VLGATSNTWAQQPAASVNRLLTHQADLQHRPRVVCNDRLTVNYHLSSLGGTVTAQPTVGFGEILSHLTATMIAADARYDRFSLLTDFAYQ
jgi:hypothetical protein